MKETSGNGDVEFYMVSPDYETFSKRWFEVVVQHPSAFLPFSSEQQQPCMEASPASTSPYVTGYSLYATSSHYQPFYRENIGQLAMRSKCPALLAVVTTTLTISLALTHWQIRSFITHYCLLRRSDFLYSLE